MTWPPSGGDAPHKTLREGGNDVPVTHSGRIKRGRANWVARTSYCVNPGVSQNAETPAGKPGKQVAEIMNKIRQPHLNK
jgi:hypothetical protein